MFVIFFFLFLINLWTITRRSLPLKGNWWIKYLNLGSVILLIFIVIWNDDSCVLFCLTAVIVTLGNWKNRSYVCWNFCSTAVYPTKLKKGIYSLELSSMRVLTSFSILFIHFSKGTLRKRVKKTFMWNGLIDKAALLCEDSQSFWILVLRLVLKTKF